MHGAKVNDVLSGILKQCDDPKLYFQDGKRSEDLECGKCLHT